MEKFRIHHYVEQGKVISTIVQVAMLKNVVRRSCLSELFRGKVFVYRLILLTGKRCVPSLFQFFGRRDTH